MIREAGNKASGGYGHRRLLNDCRAYTSGKANDPFREACSGAQPLPSTVTLTGTTPEPVMEMACAAARERSMTRPAT